MFLNNSEIQNFILAPGNISWFIRAAFHRARIRCSPAFSPDPPSRALVVTSFQDAFFLLNTAVRAGYLSQRSDPFSSLVNKSLFLVADWTFFVFSHHDVKTLDTTACENPGNSADKTNMATRDWPMGWMTAEIFIVYSLFVLPDRKMKHD